MTAQPSLSLDCFVVEALLWTYDDFYNRQSMKKEEKIDRIPVRPSIMPYDDESAPVSIHVDDGGEAAQRMLVRNYVCDTNKGYQV